MAIAEVVNGIKDLIIKNIIARTDITTAVSPGDTTISVYNSFKFNKKEEIILIDEGYNTVGHTHYQRYEYAIIKEVVDKIGNIL